jgi:signal transduction histidine kinase/CheY-like chemotaxis protein
MDRSRTRIALCMLLVLLGLAVMAGWSFGIEPLKSLLPGLPTMKFNTALGFVLVGLGLAGAGSARLSFSRAAAGAGVLVAIIGLLTLAEYLGRIDLGIDQLFVRDRGTIQGSGFPGRMSPLTASAWLSLGTAIILLALGHARRSIIIAHLLSGFAGFDAFLAVASYAFGAEAFWDFGFYTTIAIHTAFGLLVAIIPALMTRAGEGWLADFRDSPDARDLLVQLLPMAVVLPLGLGFLLLFGSGLGAYNAAFGFAFFVPCTTLALVVMALRVARRARRSELALRASETALIQSQGRLSTALAIAQLGTFDWDLQDDDVAVDARTREILGLPQDGPVHADAIIGRIHPDDRQRVLGEIRASRDAMARRESEYRIILDDGTERCIISLSDVEGGLRAERIFGVFGDITDRKGLEEDLRRLNETLEERIRQRSEELESVNEQLRQSQKLEAMGQLTGGVAHDFNNLLSPIIGSLDLLQRKGYEGERTARLIEGALASAERAKNLVQRLLAFARRQPLQTRAVDVAGLLADMADLIAATIGPRVSLAIEVEPDLPRAQADANQLEMAILNLAVNARDAMPDGGALSIVAGCATVPAAEGSVLRPGAYVRLSVADSGLGMDEPTLARAIEPFFSTKGTGRGTGLGLSMVHGLAAQLGGELRLDSKPGAGTRVELWLPVSREPVADAEIAGEANAAPASGLALLVDDEEIVRSSTAAMLCDLGYRVIEASSAEEALGHLDDGIDPDILVTDHLMPGMSGTELARLVKAGRPSLPILIISGYAEVDEIAPELQRLPKPFRQADMAAALANLTAAAAA